MSEHWECDDLERAYTAPEVGTKSADEIERLRALLEAMDGYKEAARTAMEATRIAIAERDEARALLAEAGEVLGNPDDWAAMGRTVSTWSASAFLAGETDRSDGREKAELYGVMCRLRGYTEAGERAARAFIEKLKEAANG